MELWNQGSRLHKKGSMVPPNFFFGWNCGTKVPGYKCVLCLFRCFGIPFGAAGCSIANAVASGRLSKKGNPSFLFIIQIWH